ncbi:MAG: hypothetical protein ACK5Q7_10270 [Cyanobacteriota bacterium]
MEPPPKPIPFSIPLLGVEALRQTHMDPQSWAETVSAVTPVQICEPLRPSRPFLNHSAILPIGGVVMLATQGSAITVATEQHPLAQLLIPYRGWGLWQVERSRFENPMGESLLYVPPAPLRLDNDITSGVALNLNPEALLRTALTMAGPESLPARRLGVFQEPRRLLMADPLAAPLIQAVYTCMGKIDQVAQLPGGSWSCGGLKMCCFGWWCCCCCRSCDPPTLSSGERRHRQKPTGRFRPCWSGLRPIWRGRST